MTESRASAGGKGQPSTANTGTAHLNQLAEDFGGLARSLEAQDDPDVMLAEIVVAAVAMVPGVDEGSISVVTGRRSIGSQAPTGDLPMEVDALQEETRQGPYAVHRLMVLGFATHRKLHEWVPARLPQLVGF